MRARIAALARVSTCVVLATALAPCVRVAFAQRPTTTAPRIDPNQAARDLGYTGPPNFSHRLHRSLECTSCHSSGTRHGALVVRTLHDCQSCHHAPQRQTQCSSCHTAKEIAPARTVNVVMRLSVWNTGHQRNLPFEHAKHGSLTCVTCHTTPVTLDPTKTCESCHDNHHTVDRVCRTCHLSPKPAHTRATHLGCAGAGCHTLTGTVSLQPVRNVCLTCHQDKVNHKPGQECAKCHQVQWQSNAVNPTRTGSQ
jgi:hypothetical protein